MKANAAATVAIFADGIRNASKAVVSICNDTYSTRWHYSKWRYR